VNGSGLGVTISGFVVGDIKVYKNGSTTERASTSGFALLDTDGIDFDGVTGLHGFSIDLSDNSDAGFYAAGSAYWVVVNTVTLNGAAITPLVATFRIVAAEAVAGKPKVDVDAFGGSAGTFSGGRPEVNASHWAGTATTLTSGLPDVNMKTITAGIIAAASFASGALDAVWSTATRVLTAGTNIVLAKGTGITGFNDLSAAQVNAEADTALADAGVTTTITGRIDAAISSRLASGSYTSPDNASITAIKAKTDNLPADPADASDIATSFGIVGTAITSLQSHGDGAWATASGFSTLDATDVSAAVWDVPMADHLGAGTTGDAIFQAGTHAPSADSKADTILTNIAALNDLGASDVTGAVWGSGIDGRLKSLDITNPDGIAVHLQSDVDHAILVEQNGTHEAIKVTAAGNDAVHLVGGTGGYGLRLGGAAGGIGAAEITDIAAIVAVVKEWTDGIVQTGGKLWVLDDEGNALPHAGDVVSADIKKVNGVTVQGAGTTGNEWRPA
jgi:hypothetical protein